MRRALIGLIMAATVMTPVAANAQRGNRADHYQRLEQRNQQRGEQRQARQEARQERQAQRAPRVAQQQPQQVQVAQRDGGRRGDGSRGNRGGWSGRGNDGNRGSDGNRGNRGDWNGGDRGNRGDSGYQRGWQGPNTPEYRRDADRYNRRAQENAIRYGTRDQRRDAIRDARRDGRDWRGDRDGRRDWNRGGNRGDWNRGWRNDRRYDWQRWRYSNRNIFRPGRYYAPYRGWNYSRFSIGFLLQPLFYSQRYWIGDPWQYRLPPAPYGTQWVRYYDDVLLVDIYTGEVVDAIYDFFW